MFCVSFGRLSLSCTVVTRGIPQPLPLIKGLVEITEHQMAQSKYTARKWFLFIMELHSAVLDRLHTSTFMQHYETNGTSTA